MLTAIAIAIPLLLAAILSPARYALAAESTATAATAGDDENIQFSMPTKIPFALKADGSVIAPSDWAMTIGQGSPLVKVSGFHIDGFPPGVTINGETAPCATWSNRGHETPEGDGRFVLTGEGGGKVAATGGTDDDPLCWTYASHGTLPAWTATAACSTARRTGRQVSAPSALPSRPSNRRHSQSYQTTGR